MVLRPSIKTRVFGQDSLFCMNASFETLAQYATTDRILRLVARERAKFTAKSKGKSEPKEEGTLYGMVKGMTPPHRLWSGAGTLKLPKKEERGIGKWIYPKRAASARVLAAIHRHWEDTDEPWNRTLREFIAEVQDSLAADGPLVLETPTVIPKIKKTAESGEHIFRPICLYKDLKTKVILALTYQYILDKFDRCFHDDMLFMRAARRMADGNYAMPKYLDAIDSVERYRMRCGKQNIFVGECDIQKFYDIFNHDDILACFEDLFEVKKGRGVPDWAFTPLRRVITAYLDSFDYPGQVMGKNGDQTYWQKEKRIRTKEKDPVCRFEWVDPADFVRVGCYGEEDLQKAIDGGKIGIPQGGALSGIIVNVVMRVVDKPIVTREDPQRLFIRYCDDILLMNTDRDACERDLTAYARELVRHRLLPHPFKRVADMKSGRRNKPAFWNAKSKLTYRWGGGEGDASDWVAFVGYEMRRTGERRIRKDKIDQEFKRIAHCYYRVIKAKAVKTEGLDDEGRESLMQRFDTLPGHILDYEKATDNVYSRSQARRLDKYLYKKARQAANRIGIPDQAKAAAARKGYVRAIHPGPEKG